MFTVLGRNWWLLALRGVLAIAFGILAFLMPGITLAVLVALVGAYLLVDGAAMLVALVRGDPEARRSAWSVGIMGVLGIVAGIGTFLLPDITALTLLYLTAAFPGVAGRPVGDHVRHRQLRARLAAPRAGAAIDRDPRRHRTQRSGRRLAPGWASSRTAGRALGLGARRVSWAVTADGQGRRRCSRPQYRNRPDSCGGCMDPAEPCARCTHGRSRGARRAWPRSFLAREARCERPWRCAPSILA
jgi:hypothetical protein